MRRRRYLQGVAGLAGATLAGCAGVLDGGGSAADPIEWTTAPRAGESLRPLQVAASSPSDLYATDALNDGQRVRLEQMVRFPWWRELSPERVDAAARIYHYYDSIEGYRVFEGSFSAADARERLETYAAEALEGAGGPDEDEIGHQRDHEGYEIYRAAGEVVAVGDGRLLALRFRGPNEAPSAVTRAIDAVEATDDSVLASGKAELEQLHDRLESADQWLLLLHAAPGADTAAVPGEVAGGSAFSVDGATTSHSSVYVLEDADRVEANGMAEYTPAHIDEYDDVEREIDGRIVELAATGPTSEVFFPRI